MWGPLCALARGAGAVTAPVFLAFAAGCSDAPDEESAGRESAPASSPVETPAPAAPPTLTLTDVLAAPYRREDRARDDDALIAAVLEEAALAAGPRVLEVWPGDGYWTRILAPLAAHHGGEILAVHFPTQAPDAGVRAARVVFLDRLDELSEAARRAVTVTAYDPAGSGFATRSAVDAALIAEEAAAAFAGAPDRARSLLQDLADVLAADGRVLIAATGRADAREAWTALLEEEGRRFERKITSEGWLLIVAPAG